jgi:hypothetical protein
MSQCHRCAAFAKTASSQEPGDATSIRFDDSVSDSRGPARHAGQEHKNQPDRCDRRCPQVSDLTHWYYPAMQYTRLRRRHKSFCRRIQLLSGARCSAALEHAELEEEGRRGRVTVLRSTLLLHCLADLLCISRRDTLVTMVQDGGRCGTGTSPQRAAC